VRHDGGNAKTKQQPAPPKKKGAQGKPGRPKGSKNRDKTEVTLTPELELLRTMILKQLQLINGDMLVSYIALDGKYGNNNATQMIRGCGLHLISKLRYDSALYFPYDGPYSGRGPRRKYGDKVNYDNMPAHYLRQTQTEKEIRTHIYQAQLLHSEFAQPLNVVIIHKTNLKTQVRAHVVLFSTDLGLGFEQLIDSYSLRFQLEFNFRDAKQYWGLEDFMNIKETAVTNAANLSLFMVNFCQSLLQPFRVENPDFGVLDLKAHFRGHKYVLETIKLLPQKPEPILMAHILDQISRLGSVHHAPLGFNSS
jgi:putative transposase